MSVAYSDASITDSSTEPEESSSSSSPSAVDSEAESRAKMQKMDAERLVDALRSLKYYTERKLAQLTGSGIRGGGGGAGVKNGKIPGRLSSGSESDVGEATSDEDAGGGDVTVEGRRGGGGESEGTVELFWSRWDESTAGSVAAENAAAPSTSVFASTNGNAATRHHSLSLGNTHGVNNIIVTVRRFLCLMKKKRKKIGRK